MGVAVSTPASMGGDMRRWLLLALLVVLMVPLAAQDDDPIAVIAEAQERTWTQSSYRLQGENTLTQTVRAGETESQSTLAQQVTQTVDGVFAFADTDVVASSLLWYQDLALTLPEGVTLGGDFNLELVLLDEMLYVQVPEATGDFASLTTDGWIATDDQSGILPGLNVAGGADVLAALFSIALALPVTPETVQSIEQPEPDTYIVVIDVAALAESDDLGPVQTVLASMSFGGDITSLFDALRDDMRVTITYYLSNGLIERTETEVQVVTTLAGDIELDLDLRLVSTAQYSEFGAPVEITPPYTESDVPG